jgi:hypothetical protein
VPAPRQSAGTAGRRSWSCTWVCFRVRDRFGGPVAVLKPFFLSDDIFIWFAQEFSFFSFSTKLLLLPFWSLE